MLVTYPALFYYDDTDGTEATYFVHFPDFEYSATQGEGISEALAMGSEWLGITVADLIESDGELPQPSDINSLSLIDNDPFNPNHSYLSQLDVTYKTPDLMSHFLPPHEVSFTFCCSSIVFPR
ncbi:phage-like protein [Streptococcus pneumoniae]|nr:phage-like protein [Streptococcus pneumoniae]